MPQPGMNAGSTQPLHGRVLPVVEPSPDLWARIVERHGRERQRARRRRQLVAAGTAAACMVLVGAAAWWRHSFGTDDVDWQARAQALELRLHGFDAAGAAGDSAAEAQLVQLDTLLQAAYDNGAAHDEVIALWKRRSELLDTLVRLRQPHPEIDRT